VLPRISSSSSHCDKKADELTLALARLVLAWLSRTAARHLACSRHVVGRSGQRGAGPEQVSSVGRPGKLHA